MTKKLIFEISIDLADALADAVLRQEQPAMNNVYGMLTQMGELIAIREAPKLNLNFDNHPKECL